MAVTGTPGDDVLPGPGGGSGPIYGYGGNDTINGSGADLYGGDGNDLIYGGTGEGSADLLFGDAGNDTLYGGSFRDSLSGGTGDDLLQGGAGYRTYLYGGDGDDTLDGGGLLNLEIINSNASPDLHAVPDELFGGAGADTARIGANITDIIVTGPADSLRLQLRQADAGGFFGYMLVSGVEVFAFADGTLTLDEVLALRNREITGDATDERLQGDFGEDTLFGRDGNDTLLGGEGNNQLYGGNGNDRLTSGQGMDSLYGGDGDDYLDGGAFPDLMDGGRGNDIYVVTNAADVIAGETGYAQGGGVDTVMVGIEGYVAPGNIEILRLIYSTVAASGNDAPNTLVGNASHNRLHGRGGHDQINGGDGNDTLVGGVGRDTLAGGAGEDVFVFTAVADSRVGQLERDFINGFEHGADRIDLSLIDANPFLAGDQAFRFIGTAAFGGDGAASAGEVQFRSYGGNWNIVSIDRDGNGVAEMQIFVNLTNTMAEGDFVL